QVESRRGDCVDLIAPNYERFARLDGHIQTDWRDGGSGAKPPFEERTEVEMASFADLVEREVGCELGAGNADAAAERLALRRSGDGRFGVARRPICSPPALGVARRDLEPPLDGSERGERRAAADPRRAAAGARGEIFDRQPIA